MQDRVGRTNLIIWVHLCYTTCRMLQITDISKETILDSITTESFRISNIRKDQDNPERLGHYMR